MRRQSRKSGPGPHGLPVLSILAGVLLVMIMAGCFPESNGPVRPAPIVDTEAPSPRTAAARRRFVENRPEPPATYDVPARPPRNNNFGEFEEGLYAGLDRQNVLPELPGDPGIMPMLGGPASYAIPASSYRAEVALPRSRSGPGGGSLARPEAAGVAAAASSRSKPAGIDTGDTFYAIEQLVFGGDYPDIDKPELYRLQPKDVITVTVKDHPEFSDKLEIQPDGTVRIPNAPDLVRLRGLTVDDAADEIRRTLQVYIKGETVVRVQANRARGGYYFVFGDVGQPGRFPMGLEPIRLSDAVLAANWEVNPNRMDEDEDLGPAFPAASARGKYIAPRSADLARVMLITPHRSQPSRTVHDVRSAMLGVTRSDPVVRPGQIIVVPSLDPEKNLSLGLDFPEIGVPPEGLRPGNGFSNASSPARLPEVLPYRDVLADAATVPVQPVVSNMASTFMTQHNIPATPIVEDEPEDEYCEEEETVEWSGVALPPSVTYEPDASATVMPPPGRGRRLRSRMGQSDSGLGGWRKGF
ncbi:MAG: polysaccharide biosynthesis/export family protein [Planctomycetes bacterium]|nr:polysaccharide biosynthesis/export family protein [Planctomycetota bacterium]